MATNEIISKLDELSELRQMIDELTAEADAIQDAIKAHMTANSTDTITAGHYRVTYKSVTSTRLDTTALRKVLPEVWTEFGKTSTVRRFNVSLVK